MNQNVSVFVFCAPTKRNSHFYWINLSMSWSQIVRLRKTCRRLLIPTIRHVLWSSLAVSGPFELREEELEIKENYLTSSDPYHLGLCRRCVVSFAFGAALSETWGTSKWFLGKALAGNRDITRMALGH